MVYIYCCILVLMEYNSRINAIKVLMTIKRTMSNRRNNKEIALWIILGLTIWALILMALS